MGRELVGLPCVGSWRTARGQAGSSTCGSTPGQALPWAAPEPPRVAVGSAVAVPELTGLGSHRGLEVLQGEVPKTPQTGWRCQQGRVGFGSGAVQH